MGDEQSNVVELSTEWQDMKPNTLLDDVSNAIINTILCINGGDANADE